MQDSIGGLPTDTRSRRYLERFPNSKLVRKLRERGELGPDERVVAGFPMSKVSPAINLTALIGLLPGLLAVLIVQRFSYLVVTDRRVLVTRWSTTGTNIDRVLSLDRPVYLSLSETPKKSHFFGNKVRFPQEIAGFLGRDKAYAQLGLVAAYGFQEARSAAEAPHTSTT
jgi:hypothetical protein